jgi:putative oxidoreductase
MHKRNLGRTLVIVGIIGVMASIVWWEASYDAAIRALGRNLQFSHPLGCLLFTSDACAQAKAAAIFETWPAYSPVLLWLSLAIIAAGLVVIYRSEPIGPAPITPAGEPRLLFAKLEPFYAWARDLSWPIVRFVTGGALLVGGIRKLLEGTLAGFAANSMARRGIDPSIAYYVYFNETIGAALMMLGLFTRFVAALLAIELAIVTYVVLPNGFSANSPGGGWVYPFMLGALCFAIALRGGGPYSLDRALGREL